MTSRLSLPMPIASSTGVPNTVTYMLHDDVRTRVVPYGPQGQVYTVDGASSLGGGFLDALQLNGGDGDIDDFVRTVGFWLFDEHELWIEVFAQEESEGEVPFAVAPVSNVVLDRNGRAIQELPPREALPEWAQPDDRWGKRIELDRARLVRVTLPGDYADRRLARVKRDLAAIPLVTSPDWIMEREAGKSPGGPAFDVREAARTDRLAVLQAACPIGWSGREMLLSTDRNINDFYLNLRELCFLHFLVSLRAEAETALRGVLAVASNLFGFKVEVTAHDLCTPADISRYIRQFEEGELSFSLVAEIIYQKPGLARVKRRRVV